MQGETIEFKPQPGPQTAFFETPADIAFYGGAAGGGKTFGLLLEPLRHIYNGLFRGVIFRREMPMIMNPGGLWDESNNIYPHFGCESVKTTWYAPSGWQLKFAHLFEEKDKLAYQGAQIPFLGFDEVTHFTQTQFFYLISRLRSASGVPGYVRATCNPDPDSWVADFLSWWIEQDQDHPNYGYPIPERACKLRWFVREGEVFHWADTKEELERQFGVESFPKSVTFIPAKVQDNKILLAKDPAYLGNLKAQNRVDRARLLDGNWKVRAEAGTVFRREWFRIVDALPPNIVKRVRHWDLAASLPTAENPDPDWTASCKLELDGYGTLYVTDATWLRDTPLKVETAIDNTASQDTIKTSIWFFQDPGQAGKDQVARYARKLRGYIVRAYPSTKDKVTRAGAASAAAENGTIVLLRGAWNKRFLDELEGFPDATHDDMVDAFAGAFNAISGKTDVLRAMTKK